MKTIYSLREFRDEVAKISGRDKIHVVVSAKISLFDRMEFSCYADGLSKYYTGETMEESLALLRKEIEPPSKNLIDVEIEMLEISIEEPPKEAPATPTEDLPF